MRKRKIERAVMIRSAMVITLVCLLFEMQPVNSQVMAKVIRNPMVVLPTRIEKDGTSERGYIIRGEDAIYFCDENYNVISERSMGLGRITVSKQYKYLLLNEMFNPPQAKDEPPGRNIRTLIDNTGHEYLVEESNYGWEGGDFTERFISDYEGRIYDLRPHESTLTIRDRQGDTLNVVQLFPRGGDILLMVIVIYLLTVDA